MKTDAWLLFAFLLLLVAGLAHLTEGHEHKHEAEHVEPTLPSVLDRLMMVESSGNPDARSPAGACGLYQIMQPTWEDMTDISYERCTDPVINKQVAVAYIAWLDRTLERWMGVEPSEEDMLAAWNGGIGRYRACKYELFCMPAETRNFVRKMMQ